MRRDRLRAGRSLAAALGLGLAAHAGGCLLVYDYSGYEATGGSGGSGQSCDVSEEPAKSCQACINAQCATELVSCGNTSTCIKWGECFSGCCSPSCFDGCDEEYPNNPKGDVVRDCACMRCDTECAGVMPACGS